MRKNVSSQSSDLDKGYQVASKCIHNQKGQAPIECTNASLVVEVNQENYFNMQTFETGAHINSVDNIASLTGTFDQRGNFEPINEQNFLVRKLFLEVEDRITHHFLAVSENQAKQLETIAAHFIELEKSVSNLREHFVSSRLLSPKHYVKGTNKNWNEEVNNFEEIFSKRVTIVAFERCTMEHVSKAYKNPDSAFIMECYSCVSQ